MAKETPTKESYDPNRGIPVSALKRRPPVGGDLGASPGKQQRKKSKPDRRTRRVSFAPDPELTLMHYFEKDEFSANSDGRPVLSVLDEGDDAPTVQQQLQQQHAALVETGGGGAGYQPGFLGKVVPDHCPLDSPGMDISMEITQRVLLEAQGQQQQEGEEEEEEQGLYAAAGDGEEEGLQVWGSGRLLGEVTAGLPSFGALVDEDACDEENGGQRRQDKYRRDGSSAWANAAAAAAAAAADVTMNVTQNITGGIPGLSSLIAEDEAADGPAPGEEEATAGMDLTVAAGRVLEHAVQQQQQEQQLPPLEQQPGQGKVQPPAQPEPTGEAPAEEGAAPTTGRRSSTGELARQRAVQVNKWGFAPGGEDTLDINLEVQGRMFMSENTFNGLYGDNTTGDTTLGRPLLPAGAAAALSEASPEEGSPLASVGAPRLGAAPAEPPRHADKDDLLLSPEPSPLPPRAGAQQQQQQQALPQPNWQAPAFVPPYAHKAQTVTSDHPALVQSPADTNSTMNTLETRRLSVGVGGGDTRRLSINSARRASMLQDATGRLLQDDFYDELGLDIQPAPHGPGLGAGRALGEAGGAGPDATERLLADDEEPEEGSDQDASGPLAGMKRQLRMLNQEVAAAQEPGAAADADTGVSLAEPLQQRAAAATPTPPRPAHSIGVADSSNPVTMALLRSGGTTRLLQDTVHVKPGGLAPAAGAQQQQQQLAPQRGSDAGAAGRVSTEASGGTTKLLAMDLTMASMVGAKLRGQHTGTLDQLRMSLDAFDEPPELPSELLDQHAQHARQHQQPAAQQGKGGHDYGQERVQQDERGMVHERQQQQQQQQQHDGTPPPASASQGYPLDFQDQAPTIPGGPKIHRTPVQARPSASLQAAPAATATPHSARSMRSQPQATQQASPASRRRDFTPASASAAYPVPQDDTMGIPGGPKLMRTPVGGRPQHMHEQATGGARTPLTGRLQPLSGMPGSAVAQHYPGALSGAHQQYPASALMARYPGSATAAHRLGARTMTPMQQPQPLPMTFQDFTKLMDVQFLDNLRRGASINYADMQPNAVPKTLQEAYTLLCSVSPQVAVLENGIRILQELVQERRVKSAESETFVGLHNPALFGEVQFADEERLEDIKSGVGLLKKLLRQKAVAELKAYRKEMEEDKAHRLMRNLELLQQDRLFLERGEQAVAELARAAQQHVAEEHGRMEGEAAAHKAEAERRQRVIALRASLLEQQQGDAQQRRQQQLAEARERVARGKAQSAALALEREAVRSKIEALQQRLSQTQDAAALASQASSPQALLDKSERLQVLTACTGMQLERLQQQGSDEAELTLRLGELFRAQLRVGGGAATCSFELVAGATSHLPEHCRQLAAGLLAPCGLGQLNLSPAGAGVTSLTAALQAASARLNCIAELLRELDGLRLACSSLSSVSYGADGAILLTYADLTTEVHFSVTLRVPSSYPQGELPHELKIRWDGGGHVTVDAVAAAVATAPQRRGRIRAVCAALGKLASSAPPAQPSFLQPPSPASPETAPGMLLDANFNNYSNPLFGASASCSLVS